MREDIYKGTRRKPLTAKQKLKLFVAEGGVCCVCGYKIDSVHDAWDEHVIPLIDDGSNDPSNRKVAHDKCARQKTSNEAKTRAKLRRSGEKLFGAKRPPKGRPMPGSRKSGWKKKMDGTWERR